MLDNIDIFLISHKTKIVFFCSFHVLSALHLFLYWFILENLSIITQENDPITKYRCEIPSILNFLTPWLNRGIFFWCDFNLRFLNSINFPICFNNNFLFWIAKRNGMFEMREVDFTQKGYHSSKITFFSIKY